MIFVCEPPTGTLSVDIDDLDDVLLQRLALCRSEHLSLGTEMLDHVSTGFGPEEDWIDRRDVGGESCESHLVPYLRLGGTIVMGGVSVDKNNCETKGFDSTAQWCLRSLEIDSPRSSSIQGASSRFMSLHSSLSIRSEMIIPDQLMVMHEDPSLTHDRHRDPS